jgi:hypothetical protein
MDNDLETTEKAFDEIPQEVREYIYSDEFDKNIELLFNEIGLADDKQLVLKGSIFEFIAQIDDEDDLLNTINEITSDEVIRNKIKDWIDINVSQKILSLITDAYVNDDDDDEEDSQEISTAEKPAIPSSLSSLSDRLKQASITTPAKRDYSLNKPIKKDSVVDNLSDAPSPTSHAIDPYHEPVDNE